MSDVRDTVSAAEIIRNFGYWQHQALGRPLTVTHHGRARVMLVSVDEYERLKARGELPETAGHGRDPAEGILPQILDNMAEGFVLFDEELRILDTNRVAEAYYGVSRRALVGQRVNEAVGSPANSVADQIIRRVRRSGEMASFEMESVIYPGRRVSARAFPCDGNVAIVFLNTTELETLRQQAGEMAAKTAALALLGLTGLLQLDTRGKVIDADAGFQRLTGFSADVLRQVRVIDIFSHGDRRTIEKAFDQLMQTHEPTVMTARALVRSGNEITLRLSMAAILRDFVLQGAMIAVAQDHDSVAPAA